jgi:hypothetical protein
MDSFIRSKHPQKNALFFINHKLSSTYIPQLINEKFLVKRHAEWMRCPDPASGYAWLLYARLTEAALLCAGSYADNCEYSAAGDLLANPRRIRINNINNPALSRIKNRHQPISQQFNSTGLLPETFRQKFRTDMQPCIEEEALLPVMTTTLQQSGLFHEAYLLLIKKRMNQIADTLAFLAAWQLEDTARLHERLASASSDDRRFIESNLCRFDRLSFDALGSELHALEQGRPVQSAFLKKNSYNMMPIDHEESDHDATFAYC